MEYHNNRQQTVAKFVIIICYLAPAIYILINNMVVSPWNIWVFPFNRIQFKIVHQQISSMSSNFFFFTGIKQITLLSLFSSSQKRPQTWGWWTTWSCTGPRSLLSISIEFNEKQIGKQINCMFYLLKTTNKQIYKLRFRSRLEKKCLLHKNKLSCSRARTSTETTHSKKKKKF